MFCCRFLLSYQLLFATALVIQRSGHFCTLCLTSTSERNRYFKMCPVSAHDINVHPGKRGGPEGFREL